MMNNTKQQVNLQAQKPKFSSKVTLLRVNEHFFSSGGKLDKQHSFTPKKDFLAFKAKEKFAFYSSPFIFKSDTRSKKKSSTYTWEVLQKFKIVRFRLTYFAQIALTFDRIFYLQKH